jgi:hypothetical protein
VLYSSKTGWWKLTDFGITTAATTTAMRPTEGSRCTVCYVAPEVLKGKFNKKADIWALGCILYELCTGIKAFETDWSIVIYTLSPESRSFNIPFTSAQSKNPTTRIFNSLLSSMIQIEADRRCNVHELCTTINGAFPFGERYDRGSDTIFFKVSQLIGTEVPVPTCLFPDGFNQILPPSALYPDLELVVERRKAIVQRREAVYGSSHRLTIWAYLYLAYTQHYSHLTQVALQTLSLALIFNSRGDSVENKAIHSAITFAFSRITMSLDISAGYKMFDQLRSDARAGRIELDAIERLRLDVGILIGVFPVIRRPDSGWGVDFPSIYQAPVMFEGLVGRLMNQENVGSEHVLTMLVKYHFGMLELRRDAEPYSTGGTLDSVGNKGNNKWGSTGPKCRACRERHKKCVFLENCHSCAYCLKLVQQCIMEVAPKQLEQLKRQSNNLNTALTIARKILPRESRDLLEIELSSAIRKYEFLTCFNRTSSRRTMLQALEPVLMLLPRVIEVFGMGHSHTRTVCKLTREAAQKLKESTTRARDETPTEAKVRELISAYYDQV